MAGTRKGGFDLSYSEGRQQVHRISSASYAKTFCPWWNRILAKGWLGHLVQNAKINPTAVYIDVRLHCCRQKKLFTLLLSWPCIALVLILGFPVGFPSSSIEFVVSCLSSEPLVADFVQALKDIQSCLRDKTAEASALSLTDRHRSRT